jgi:alkylation response protein AidB-like acyl-CoA dehydrogenase
MNFGFTEEQELLRKTARDFLAEHAPMSRVREIVDGDAPYSRPLWSALAELGWTGLMLPETYGGAGLSIVELCVVLEELGRGLTPVPFLTTAIAGSAILELGDEALRAHWLPRIASGSCVATLAVPAESGSGGDEGVVAVETHDGARLDGHVAVVPDAVSSDVLIVLARFPDGGEALFVVPSFTPGLAVTPLPGMDRLRPVARVELRGVAVPWSEILPDREGGVRCAIDRALVIIAAEMVGGAEACLESSVGYATQRVQFGKPIGVHQAIKHKCADMLFGVESVRSIAYYAAWAARERAPDAAVAAAMAKATACDAFRRAAQENLQIHGGVGFTWEYDCHLYLKRAKTDESWLGDAESQRRRIALLLGI